MAGSPPAAGRDAAGGVRVRVVPDVRGIRRRFDYLVPAATCAEPRVGDRVRVDLHGRRVDAWIAEVDPADAAVEAVKPVLAWKGLGPPERLVEVCGWAAARWAGPLAVFLSAASPERVLRERPRPPASSPAAPESPGGASPSLVEAALAAGSAVVRLAPALDESLLVREVLHRRGVDGALVCCPTLEHAEDLGRRLRRAGIPAAVLGREWERVRRGGVVAIGARSAAFAPVERCSSVVVLDAHHEAYREQSAPTWSAVEVAAERARRDGAPFVAVSPVPTVELCHGRALVETDRATERRGWPRLEVVDERGEDPRSGRFSERFVALATAALAAGERVVAVYDRTGRIRMLACRACGAVAGCHRCGAAVEVVDGQGARPSLAAPLEGATFVCPSCAERRPPVCSACDGRRFRLLRVGVEHVAEQLGVLLGHPVRSVSGPAGPEPEVAADRSAPLVVGTQAALARGGPAALVAFLGIDHHLFAPRFRAGEETAALIAQAARMAGASGTVLVQTRAPDHPVLDALRRARPGELVAAEEPVRAELALPPFGAVASISGPGAAELALSLGSDGRVEVFPSAGGTAAVVRAPDHAALSSALAAAGHPSERVRVAVDVVDMA